MLYYIKFHTLEPYSEFYLTNKTHDVLYCTKDTTYFAEFEDKEGDYGLYINHKWINVI